MGRKSVLSVIALCFAIALLLPAARAHAESYKPGVYRINTQSDDLNVRSCPSSSKLWVGSIPKDTVVNVTLISGSWGKTVYGSAHGWIFLDYCKYIGPLEEKTVSDDANVNYGISAKNLTWVTGWKQEYSYSSGLCTSCATTTLLRRRQAAEGKPVTYVFGDTRSSCGGDPNPDSKGYYKSCPFYFTPENGWVHVDEVTGEKTVYRTVREEEKVHTHNREYLVDLLDVHPEGVVVYAAYANGGRHAILISDYKRNSDGSLQFYAYDPVQKGARTKLEDTWMMTKYNSVGGYFDNVISIWYIKGELTVDDSKFDHPEAQAFSANMLVTKKNTPTYTKASSKSGKVEKLGRNTVIHVNYMVTDKNGDVWYITDDNTYIAAAKVKLTDLPVTEKVEEDAAENASDISDTEAKENAASDASESITEIENSDIAESADSSTAQTGETVSL